MWGNQGDKPRKNPQVFRTGEFIWCVQLYDTTVNKWRQLCQIPLGKRSPDRVCDLCGLICERLCEEHSVYKQIAIAIRDELCRVDDNINSQAKTGDLQVEISPDV